MTRRATGAIRVAAYLVVALLLAAACAGNSNPTGNPASARASASPGGAASLPAGSFEPGTTPEPGTTLEPGTTPETGTTREPGMTPEPGTTPEPGETAGPTPVSGASSTPSDGGAGDPLPACAYKDVAAMGDPNRDWATMVLDTIYRLPSNFVPKHLVPTSQAGMNGGLEVIPALVDDLREMHEASVEDSAEIAVRWAYRSYGEQAGAFAYWVRQSGRQEALRLSARPGHSEHQLGTAVDFRSADSDLPPWDYDDWGTTEPGEWMASHAWRYGFLLSYPKGQQSETCYGYEPWHYRYVGRQIAKDVHESGETLRRYLWEHYAANR